jgi:hypothetical protein
VPLASNAVAAVVAVVVWPSSCLALVRVLAGPSWAALAAAPVVAVGFIAFPWSLLGFGVLWPNLVGMSLGPAAWPRWSLPCRPGPRGRSPWRAVLLLRARRRARLGHPIAVFGLAVLGAFPVAVASRACSPHRERGRRGAAVAVLAGWWRSRVSPAWCRCSSLAVFDDIRSFDWPAFQSPAEAARQVALGATNDRSPAWVLAVLVLVGAAASWRTGYRWLLPAHLAAGALYLAAASTESPLTAAVTAFWYNDRTASPPCCPSPGAAGRPRLLAVGALLHRVAPGSSGRDPVQQGADGQQARTASGTR